MGTLQGVIYKRTKGKTSLSMELVYGRTIQALKRKGLIFR